MISLSSFQRTTTRRRRFVPLACLGLALYLALASQAGFAQTVYRWVDENGTVHFGESPPEGVEATAIDASPKSSGVVPQKPENGAQTTEQTSVAQQKRDERAERAREERERKAAVAAACEEQRALLARLEPRPKILVRDPDGTTRMLPDDERLEAIENARKFIRENCD